VAIFRRSQSVRLRSLDFDELLPCLGRNRIAGIAAVLNVKLNGFTYVAQRFRAVVSWLTQPGNAGTLAT